MKFITQIPDQKKWDTLLKESSCSSFFQSIQCYNLYKEMPFMQPFIYSVEEDGVLKGVMVGYIQKEKNLLKQFFSKRAIVPGGVLLSNNISNETLTSYLRFCIHDLSKQAIYIEIRNYTDYSQYEKAFEDAGLIYLPHLNFHIDTSSSQIVQDNIGKSRKRDINTSLKNGAKILLLPTIKDVQDYYFLLQTLYKKKVKTPLFPWHFFQTLYNSEHAHFFLVEYDKTIIGGTLCVGLKKNLYEWFACGEDGKYKNVYPSTLATYAGIQYAVEHNYSVFDMMGAGKPNESYGVRDFKAKFGGVLLEQGRFLFVCNRLLYSIGCLAIKIIKKKR